MGINFPNAPTTNQLYPQPPVAGLPVYRWDGTKWTTTGANSVYVYVADAPPSAPDSSLWWESDSGVLYLRYNDGDSSQWVAVTPVANPPAPVLDNDVGRNLLHNSLFNIQQRGAGPWTSPIYTADRWLINFATDSVSISLTALTDADRAAIGDEAATTAWQNVFTGNAAAGAFEFAMQRVEGVRRLGGKIVTISFWAKAASGAPKIGVNLNQVFGTGGSPSAALWVLATGVSVPISTSWARYSATIAMPSTSGKTLGSNGDDYTGLGLWFSSGATSNANAGNIGVQSGTIQIWGIQLEVGTVATPLEKPDPQQDLAKCQRFYQIVSPFINSSYGNAGQLGYFSTGLPVPMRANPSLVFSGTNYANASALAVWTSGVASIGFQVNVTATGFYYCFFTVTASADL
jgi:hypothetical protein